MNPTNTIEVLSCPQTTGDLWEELNQESSIHKKFQHFAEDSQYDMRLLGPFMQIKRLYNPQPEIGKEFNIDVDRIANNDNEYFDATVLKLRKIIQDKRHNEKKINEFGKFILDVYKNQNLQSCIITNAYIKWAANSAVGKVKLVALTYGVCKEIAQRIPDSNTRIGGLRARDITIKRKGSGLITRYDVELEQETFLGEDEVKKIFSKGLLDIPSVLKSINKTNGSYYYKIPITQYRMPEELSNVLFEAVKEFEEGKHLRRADVKINTLPHNAFEKNKHRGPIDSLEIE